MTMKPIKAFFTAAFLLLASEAFSQVKEGSIYYIEVVPTNSFSLLKASSGGLKCDVYITTASGDIGSSSAKRSLADAAGNKISFDNVLGALNYLGRDGWELVSALPTFIPDDATESKSDMRQYYYTYLMKLDTSKHPRNAITDFIDSEITAMKVFDKAKKGMSQIVLQ